MIGQYAQPNSVSDSGYNLPPERQFFPKDLTNANANPDCAEINRNLRP